MPRVLLVENDRFARYAIREMLLLEGCEIEEASDGDDAVERMQKSPPFDLIVVETHLSRVIGRQELRQGVERYSRSPVIFTSAIGTWEEYMEVMDQGAFDYFAKPFNAQEFRRAVRIALGNKVKASGETCVIVPMELKQSPGGSKFFL